jgi:hypothetical protein
MTPPTHTAGPDTMSGPVGIPRLLGPLRHCPLVSRVLVCYTVIVARESGFDRSPGEWPVLFHTLE